MTYFYEKIIMSFLFSYKHEIEMERELPMLFAAGFHTMYLRTKGTNFFHICISHSQPLVGFVRQQKQTDFCNGKNDSHLPILSIK